jgi:hypothetical protein
MVEIENLKKKRKADALTLARILYDIFKEKQRVGIISTGQNNANQLNNK